MFNTSVRQVMFYVIGLVYVSVCLNELSLPGLRYFFTYLLPHQAPPGLTHLVDHIMNSTGENERDVLTRRDVNYSRSESKSAHHRSRVMTRLASFNEFNKILHDMYDCNEYNLFCGDHTGAIRRESVVKNKQIIHTA